MTWVYETTPPAPGRYAVTVGPDRTWMAGNWTAERGWTDGVNKINGVTGYCAVPPPNTMESTHGRPNR